MQCLTHVFGLHTQHHLAMCILQYHILHRGYRENRYVIRSKSKPSQAAAARFPSDLLSQMALRAQKKRVKVWWYGLSGVTAPGVVFRLNMGISKCDHRKNGWMVSRCESTRLAVQVWKGCFWVAANQTLWSFCSPTKSQPRFHRKNRDPTFRI